MDLKRLHDNAVSLNNLGAILLHQGAVTQALETLRDAVEVMNLFCSLNEEDASCEESMLEKSMAKVETAKSLLSNHSMQCNGSTTARTRSSLVELLEWDNLDLSRAIDLAPGTLGCECQVVFSLTANKTVSGNQNSHQRDPEMDSSVMLYNYGVAHLALMYRCSNGARINPDALDLFRLSVSIVYSKFAAAVLLGDGSGLHGTTLESISGLMFASLRNLAATFLNEGKIREAVMYHEKISEILQALLVSNEMDSFFVRDCAAAAA